MRFTLLVIAALITFCSAQAIAQDEAKQSTTQAQGGGGDLAAKTQNPVGAMYSLPFKFSFDSGASNGEAYFLNIQPVIPITVGDWNLINRVIIPLIDTPGGVTGTPEIPNPGDGDVPPGWATSTTRYTFHRPTPTKSSGVSAPH